MVLKQVAFPCNKSKVVMRNALTPSELDGLPRQNGSRRISARLAIEEREACAPRAPASCPTAGPAAAWRALADRLRGLRIADRLRYLATLNLERIARGGFRTLVRSAGACAPWVHEAYYSRRYAAEYSRRTFAYEPLISIIIPVYNPPPQYLAKAIASIEKQEYARWELCIADDASTLSHVRPCLEKLRAKESRAKVVFLRTNRHISGATNAAMRLATGEYFLFMDDDDALFTPWALTAFADALQEDRADLLYADNVIIDARGTLLWRSPKPDWEVDFLRSTHYITHPLMVSRGLVERLGGFRAECSGAQDVDLVNRACTRSRPRRSTYRSIYTVGGESPGSVTMSTDAKPGIMPRFLRHTTTCWAVSSHS